MRDSFMSALMVSAQLCLEPRSAQYSTTTTLSGRSATDDVSPPTAGRRKKGWCQNTSFPLFLRFFCEAPSPQFSFSKGSISTCYSSPPAAPLHTLLACPQPRGTTAGPAAPIWSSNCIFPIWK